MTHEVCKPILLDHFFFALHHTKLLSALGTQDVHDSIGHSHGIYPGLPVFPDDVKGLTAIVTGANGISGCYMLKVLSQAPQRWSKIYCLSRRPPLIDNGLPPNAEHIALDFLKDPEDIASVLRSKNISSSSEKIYVFFFSYIQAEPKPGARLCSDAQKKCRINSLLLDNFLATLVKADISPQRFMLQTGAKNYGGHLGPTKVPQEETDPRVELESNFYYPQEDSLFEYCQQQGVGWYGEWAFLSPAARDRKFNTCDNSAFTWEGCGPSLPLGPDTEADTKWVEKDTRFNLRGYRDRVSSTRKFTFVQWAQRPKVVSVWKDIAEQNGLALKELEDTERVFGVLDMTFSADKARKFGWHGFVDSPESLLEVFDNMARIRIISLVPRIKVEFN
ncbi:hypothetical protein LTR41_010949 [Exophiala xenobiotica]|nr:hypothetical protein LTR41_010949 [Exophiala xenobiotica]KAK5551117.1 hypothetical protein LTR46_010870 [Exophiala xenobiotica]